MLNKEILWNFNHMVSYNFFFANHFFTVDTLEDLNATFIDKLADLVYASLRDDDLMLRLIVLPT